VVGDYQHGRAWQEEQGQIQDSRFKLQDSRVQRAEGRPDSDHGDLLRRYLGSSLCTLAFPDSGASRRPVGANEAAIKSTMAASDGPVADSGFVLHLYAPRGGCIGW
jgi:hypothetical protein